MSKQSNNLKNVLNKIDSIEKFKSEFKISDFIRKIQCDDKDMESKEHLIAEKMAFGFYENYQNEETGWGTYYGPMMVLNNQDGTTLESPSIKKITSEIIDIWTKRSNEAKSPILKSRYADLVWDFSKIVTGKQANFKLAHIVIDNILKISQNDYYEHETDVITKLSRALSISISLNDQARIERVRDAIIDFEDKIAKDDKPGLWVFAYDLLLLDKKVSLKDIQKNKIINDIENRLQRLSLIKESKNLNPWAAEAAATRLANYYRNQNKADEVKRVLIKYHKIFEISINSASPIQASAWLQHIYRIYLEYGLKNEAENITIKLRNMGPQINRELKPISHSMQISKKQMDDYVEAMIDGNLEHVLVRIASQYIPKKDEIENQIAELSKNAPISFLFSKQIQDHRGRTVAVVGSLEGDLIGNIVRQSSQNMQISSIFLREVMENLILKFNLSYKEFIEYFYNSPIFEEEKKEIIEKGIMAYLENNYLISIHLLIPQIETAIRNLIEKSGGSVLKPARNGGFNLKTLGDILRDPILVNVFSEDVALYFRILLTDQRGWNLRNNVCHGILPSDSFLNTIADRIIHVFLCLSLVKEKKDE